MKMVKGRWGDKPKIKCITGVKASGKVALNSISFGIDKLRVLLGGYQGLKRRLLF